MKTLIILRGIPGSGKSTVAEFLSEDGKYPVCTTDDFFMKDGVYNFNISQIGIAHKVCQEKAQKMMESGHEKVFIANTNTTQKELNTYINMANDNGYRVMSLIVENRHGNTNEHNVPAATLEAMRNRFVVQL
jgi:predicted kinase